MGVIAFDSSFRSLTGHLPFPWQTALYNKFAGGEFPAVCAIPTGLGKTSVMAAWLLALAERAISRATDFPRRLVYVVNRRTVVDQATREAEELRTALRKAELKPVAEALAALAIDASGSPLAISTLRGEFADNAEWRMDPARPAIIVGTVDMIGSRLLFSGYGRGFKSRPLHAAFLGQDTLLVHDEAHLEPAFQALLEAIVNEQARYREFRPMRVMQLTATPRTAGNFFELDHNDRRHEEVKKRTRARKGVALHAVSSKAEIAEKVAELALGHRDSRQAVLVYLRELRDVERVCGKLDQAGQEVRRLTGTIRGWERDRLASSDRVFARFLPKPSVSPLEGTVYLVCTSAGEVGVDISADHLVCDLTPFDVLVQRLGRVNRFGVGDANVDLVYMTTSGKSGLPPALEQVLTATLALVRELPKRADGRLDASPATLAALPIEERMSAFTPEPEMRPATDILFDRWALTSIRGRLPGRPPVADWLHGVSTWEPPETHVAWRTEVVELGSDQFDREEMSALLDEYPLKPHELLRDRSDRVLEHLGAIAKRTPDLPVWVISDEDGIEVMALADVAKAEKDAIADRIVLLPPQAGGLDLDSGVLSGRREYDASNVEQYDIADLWLDEDKRPRRARTWDDSSPRHGMRLVRVVDVPGEERNDDDEPMTLRRWYWFVRPRSADDDGSWTSRSSQRLREHAEQAGLFASQLAERLGLERVEAEAVVFAAFHHDDGKDLRLWQRSIGNLDYPNVVLAKSGGRKGGTDRTSYRHEFGSLHRLTDLPEFRALDLAARDLVAHLIAAHHGRARPHFPADEAFDPDRGDDTSAALAADVIRRYGRLQRKYGRWGLAYLESLVRAADALASGEAAGVFEPQVGNVRQTKSTS